MALIARGAGLSVTNVRSWRDAQTIGAKNRRLLAEFAAICTLVRQLDSEIEKLDRWWRVPVVAGGDLQRIDLYLQDQWMELAAIAAERRR